MKRTIALLLAVIGLTAPAIAEEPSSLTLVAVNVGKADALLLFSGGDVWLIDTGTSQSWGALSAALCAHRITRLTGVIVTHTDKDHAGGLEALASSSVEVGGWYAPAFCAKYTREKHPAVLAAARRNQAVTWLNAGDGLPLSGGRLTVLGPTEYSDTENCNSLVLLAEGGGGTMLLAGDMEFPEEKALMAAGAIGHADVLKVGNHGESDATSEEFARLVSPAVAVISTNSAEEPDTPAKRVVRALNAVGARLLFTETASGGVRVTLTQGRADTELAAWDMPEKARGVAISGKNVKADTVTLTNSSDSAVDLSRWFIRSGRGGEIFVFPDGAVIAPGKSITVSAIDSPSQGDYVWLEKKVWHKSKSDEAVLYDAWGREIDARE